MFWKKKVAVKDREIRELLRENLNTVNVDVFYGNDPLIAKTGDVRKLYLKKFFDIFEDKEVMDRIEFLVNKQANLTLKAMQEDDSSNNAGAMNINGMCLVRDEIKRLANMYVLEEGSPPEEFDKHSVT